MELIRDRNAAEAEPSFFRAPSGSGTGISAPTFTPGARILVRRGSYPRVTPLGNAYSVTCARDCAGRVMTVSEEDGRRTTAARWRAGPPGRGSGYSAKSWR